MLLEQDIFPRNRNDEKSARVLHNAGGSLAHIASYFSTPCRNRTSPQRPRWAVPPADRSIPRAGAQVRPWARDRRQPGGAGREVPAARPAVAGRVTDASTCPWRPARAGERAAARAELGLLPLRNPRGRGGSLHNPRLDRTLCCRRPIRPQSSRRAESILGPRRSSRCSPRRRDPSCRKVKS